MSTRPHWPGPERRRPRRPRTHGWLRRRSRLAAVAGASPRSSRSASSSHAPLDDRRGRRYAYATTESCSAVPRLPQTTVLLVETDGRSPSTRRSIAPRSRRRRCRHRCGAPSSRSRTQTSSATTGWTRRPSCEPHGTTSRAVRSGRATSTITQQYVKNVFTGSERSIGRKVEKAILALSSSAPCRGGDLAGYLSTLYFGHGAYGVEAASRLFFRRNAEDLSLLNRRRSPD